jgi:predicted branched-subunit amino acid permease
MSRDNESHNAETAAPLAKVAGTFAGFRLGAMMALPVIPGMVAFGLAVGATAARKGLGFADNLLMNLLVYAGMSQLVALDAWPERFGVATVAGLAILCAIVNARLLLMGASLQPWLGGLPRSQIYPSLHLLTDPGWLIAMRYRADRGSDVGVFFGSSVVLYLAWIAAIVAGHLMGALVADPRRFGNRPADADLLRRHADPALARRAAGRRLGRRRSGGAGRLLRHRWLVVRRRRRHCRQRRRRLPR